MIGPVGVHHLCLALGGLETNVGRVEHRRNYPKVGPAAAFEEVRQDCSRDAPVNTFGGRMILAQPALLLALFVGGALLGGDLVDGAPLQENRWRN